MDARALLDEQIAYYRARAPEYDRWWHRTDQYALAGEHQEQWHAEVAALEAAVLGWIGAPGQVLEIASGTGIWTTRLAAAVGPAGRVVAVDAAPETIAIARAKLASVGLEDRVEFVRADVFEWTPPPAKFDVVFFSFWLSHVPPDLLDRFWTLVESSLVPGGRVVLIDNRWNDGVWPPAGERPADAVQLRTDLSSGDAFRIVKVYYEPGELDETLRRRGWSPVEMTATGRFFVAGAAGWSGR